MRSLSLAFALCLLLGARAQAPAPAPAAPTAFDAASIRPSKPPSDGRMMMGLRTDPGRLTAQNMPLRQLIVAAYGLKPYQVQGPGWMDDERFDINAETTSPLTRPQMLKLLRPFLVRQFQLASHRITKTMNIYALVVAKGGPKMKRTAEKSGRFRIALGQRGARLNGAATMSDFVGMLAMQTDRPVVDMTGLEGTYAIQLNFMPSGGGRMIRVMPGGPPPGGGPPRAAAATAAAGQAPSLFTALPEQLGLKLDPRKGPIAILVIDHAAKTPLGN